MTPLSFLPGYRLVRLDTQDPIPDPFGRFATEVRRVEVPPDRELDVDFGNHGMVVRTPQRAHFLPYSRVTMAFEALLPPAAPAPEPAPPELPEPLPVWEPPVAAEAPAAARRRARRKA